MATHRGRKNVYDLMGPPILRSQLAPVLKATHQQPPDHLGEPERQIWSHVLSDYRLETQTATAVLVSALEAHQRARMAREVIDRDGMTVVGRDGQAKAHPLLQVERDARSAWLMAIKTLGLSL
jgi:P27 family predicted phage terminase small subunit